MDHHYPTSLEFDAGAALAAIPANLKMASCAILLVNSHAEGLANSTSDLDLMLVQRAGDSPVENWLQAFGHEQRYDIHVIGEDVLRSRLMFDAPGLPAVHFLHKIRHAKPILGVEYWRDLLKFVVWKRFDELLIHQYSGEANMPLEDIVGNLNEGDVASGVLNARRLVEASFDAYLASIGEAHPRPKWRLKKARRALGFDAPLLLRFLDFELMAPIVPEDAAIHWICNCLQFVRLLQLHTFFSIPNVGRPVDALNAFSAPPYSICTPLGDAFVVHASKPVARLSRSDTLTWLLAPCVSNESELLLRYLEVSSQTAIANTGHKTESGVLSSLERLIETGLIVRTNESTLPSEPL